MNMTFSSFYQALNDCQDSLTVKAELVKSIKMCPFCNEIITTDHFEHLVQHSKDQNVEKIMALFSSARDGVKLGNYLAMEIIMQHVPHLPQSALSTYKMINGDLETWKLHV